MIEMMLQGGRGKLKPGLSGSVFAKTKNYITGFAMKMSTNGKFLVSGNPTAGDGTGHVYVTDLSVLTQPTIKKTITLPEWRTGTAEGTYTRAGYTVKASGDIRTLAVSTQNDGADLGAVYVINLDADQNVVDSVKLLPPGTVSNDYLSTSCDMSDDGNVIVVSANGYNAFSGRAYIYTRNSSGIWGLEKTLDIPAGTSGRRFGTPVSIGTSTGELVAISTMPSSSAGSSRVFLYKRNGGAWDRVATIADTRNISGAGRTSGYLSGDGTRLAVSFSYHNVSSTEKAGFDIYSIDQGTGEPTKIETIAMGLIGGGMGINTSLNDDGTTILSSLSTYTATTYDGLDCIQYDPELGAYAKAWNFKTAAIGANPVFPITNSTAKTWALCCPSLILTDNDSFFCGR